MLPTAPVLNRKYFEGEKNSSVRPIERPSCKHEAAQEDRQGATARRTGDQREKGFPNAMEEKTWEGG